MSNQEDLKKAVRHVEISMKCGNRTLGAIESAATLYQVSEEEIADALKLSLKVLKRK